MLQEPQPENFHLKSLNEIEFDVGVQVPPSFAKLSRDNSKSLKGHSFSLPSAPATATSTTSSRKISSDQSWDSVQTAMLGLVLKKNVTIQALPEVLDFNSYSITVFGNSQSLSTNERSAKSSSNEPIYLTSYRTNILKIKSDFFKSSHKTMYLYNSESPTKFGEIKKGEKGTNNLNIYGPAGDLMYVIEGGYVKKNKKPLLSSLICGASKLNSKSLVGKLVLKDVKTGESFELGSYYNNPVVSNDKKKTFNALCYDLEFPSDFSNDGKTLITAALFCQIPRSTYYKSLA